MKVADHIGQAKTGTTSIQRFFRKNQNAMLQQGFLYPSSHLGGSNHAILTVPLFGKVQRSLKARTGPDFETALKLSHEAWGNVSQQIEEHKPDTVILSSEFLFNARNTKLLEDLLQEYIPGAQDLKFIAYLRMRSQHYPSALQQKLKASRQIPRIGAKWNPAGKLNKFSEIGEVVVRKFARDQLKNGDIVDDICDALGVMTAGFQRVPGDSNTSISAEATIVLQEYRRTHHANRDGVFTPDTKDLLKKMAEEELQSPGTYTRPRLRREIAQALDQDAPAHRKLKEQYGVDLSFDHGVTAIEPEQLAKLTRAEQVLEFDPDLLDRMRSTVD